MLCISLSTPPAHPAVSVRMKRGLSRLCHITCFFTWTIRLRPRLSRALLLSLFSMPDKLSGCLSLRFFPEKWPHSIVLHWLKLIKKKKKASFNYNSSLRKRRGSLKEPSQTRKKRKKTLRTSPLQPWLDLSFLLTVEIHQRECRLVHRISTANSRGKAVMLWTNGCFCHLSFCPPPTWPPPSRSTIRIPIIVCRLTRLQISHFLREK